MSLFNKSKKDLWYREIEGGNRQRNGNDVYGEHSMWIVDLMRFQRG